ncbi:YcjF family protein [Alkalilimnicola sp. S0819]|uniref:YcjF family protein n=1 Tax=Alkalilimnicola sp. S0819 TaxID=2613922 RepID=UPI001869ED06|nr:DUF697 domain-containing protein [Alkalilimnicola sp. S0819]
MATTSSRKAETAEAAAEPSTERQDLDRALVADNQIKNYVIASVGASIVPVPLFDIAAVFAIQMRMIQKLSQLYGTPFSEGAVRNTAIALGGGVLGYGAGATVAVSLTKIIPGVGWMLGMAALPVVSGASTYAVGRVYLKHFQEGGSVLDLNHEKMRAYYREQFEKGKQLAAKARAELKARKGGVPQDDSQEVA